MAFFDFEMSDVNFIIVKPELPQANFLSLAAEQFPAVADDILEEGIAGLIHLQVACLTRYANDCIEGNDLPEFERILRFVDEVLLKADSLLDNALHVSFVEDLWLDEDTPVRQAARQLLYPWQIEFYVAIRNWESEHTGRNRPT